MDPRRKLQVVSAANPSLRVSAAPQQISVQPVSQPNVQLKVAAAPQQQIRINQPAPQAPADKYDFSTYGMDNKRGKKLFGLWDVSKPLNSFGKATGMGDLGYQYDFNINGKYSDTKDNFIKGFDSLGDEFKQHYVAGITKKAQEGDQAAINAWVALRDAGKFKGNANDFIAGSNEKFYGGSERELLRLAGLAASNPLTDNPITRAIPGWNKKVELERNMRRGLENTATSIDKENLHYTDAGKWGMKAGSVEKGIMDTALLVTGAGAAEKAAMKVPTFARIATAAPDAANAVKIGSYVARQIPGSAAGTAISLAQTKGNGEDPNIGQSVAIGTAADLVAPALFKGVGKAYQGFKGLFSNEAKTTAKYLAAETNFDSIKSVLDSLSVPTENIDDLANFVAKTNNPSTIEKLVNELSLDPNLKLTDEVRKRLQDEGVKAVKEDPNAQYDAQYQDGNITARDQAQLDRNVYHELGHHIYQTKMTPEERALFNGTGNASKQAVGRPGYTQSDVNSEDFSDYLDKALRGNIDQVPTEYRAVVSKYAKIADDIAATEKIPTGASTPQTTPIQTPRKIPVGNYAMIKNGVYGGDINEIAAAVKTKENAADEISRLTDQFSAEGNYDSDKVIQKTINNLAKLEQTLPSEAEVLARQGVTNSTLQGAGQELSGVTSAPIVDDTGKVVDQAAGLNVADNTSTDAAKTAQQVSDAAAAPVYSRTNATGKLITSDGRTNAPRITQDDLVQIEALTAQMNKLYADADALDAAAIKAASVDGVPSTSALAGADVAPEAVTAPISPPGNTNTLTSSPSTEKNSGSLLNRSVIDDPLSTSSIANNAPEVKNISERGFAKSLAQTDAPPEVYENLLGYTQRPNPETFTKAANDIAGNFEDTLNKLTSKAGELTDDEVAQGLLTLDHFVGTDQIDLATRMAEKLNISGTESGRAVQILSALKKTTPAGTLKEAQKIVQEAIDKGLLPKGYVIPKEQMDQLLAQADYIQAVKAAHTEIDDALKQLDPSSPEYTQAIKDLADAQREYELSVAIHGKYLKELVPPQIGDKLNSLVNISLLLNPKTFVRNVIGNTANAAAETVSNTIASPLDMLASLRTGKRTTSLPSIISKFTGFGRGLKEGAQETELGIRIGTGGKYDVNPAIFKNRAMRRIEKTLGHSLSDTDKAFYTSQFDDTLNSLMKTNKVTKPTQEMLDIADQEGLYATFQGNSNISKSLQWLKAGMNKANIKGFGMGDVLLRYPKTPGNIVAVGLDYSPYGFVKGLVQFAKLNEKSTLAAQRAAVRNLGRGITGSGLIAGGYYLAQNGIITANKSSDMDVASLQRNQGQPPFSFNLSAMNRLLHGEDTAAREGDVVSTYDWLQPNAIQLSMGANMALNKGKGATDWISTALDQASSGLETIEEQPVFKTTGTFLKTATTPADRGGGVINAAADAAVGLPSMFVPSVLNQTAGAIDNTARTSYDPNPLVQAGKKVVAKIPGATKFLEPVVDTFGNEVKRQQTDNPVTRVFNSFVNPAFVTKISQTPEGQMVLGIYNQSGETGQFPRVTGRSMQINGEKYTLTPKEITEFQKYTGKKTQEAFAALADNPSFMALDDTAKANAMASIVTDISSAARIEVLGNKPKTVDNNVKSIVNGKTLDYISKVPEGVDGVAKDYFTKTAYMDDATYKTWLNGAPDEMATATTTELNGKRPAGTNALTPYNGLTKRYAEYQKAIAEAKKDGTWSKLDNVEKEQEFWKGAIKDSKDNLTKDIYDAGSGATEDYWKQGLINKTEIDQAIALDDELYRSGLSSSLKFGKTFRRNYGYGIPTAPGDKASGSGSGSGGSKASKKMYFAERKLNFNPSAAPDISSVPKKVQLKLQKPAAVQVTPVRIKL